MEISVSDHAMPFLAAALDPAEARRKLDERLLDGEARVSLNGVRLVRHKPGRRCLIEYDVELRLPGGHREEMTLLGKSRARGLDCKGYRIQRALREAGFDERHSQFCVPETFGVIPEFHMWLQRKVPGVPATGLLAEPDGAELARGIASLSDALHRAGITPLRSAHTVADELRILSERLPEVAREQPRLGPRLERLLVCCEHLDAQIPRPRTSGIHRDFYADQVLVDGERLYLLDLDLYCEGDPALDIGNFLAHITEYSLRELGDPATLVGREEAMEEEFLRLSDGSCGEAVRAYATLTLARHVHISTLFPERREFTGWLLKLCEERLGIPSLS